MTEILVSPFQTSGMRFDIDDPHQWWTFIATIAGGDTGTAIAWRDAMQQGEVIILNQDGPVADWIVLTMPAYREAEVRAAAQRHPSSGNPRRIQLSVVET